MAIALSSSQLRQRFPLGWKPVNAENLAEPPAPWRKALEEERCSLHSFDRVARFWTTVCQDRNENLLIDPVSALGESLFTSFDAKHYPKKRYGAFDTERWVAATAALATEFGNHIPTLLWETIAAVGSREDPHVEDTILNVQESLPANWGMCDAALHALGKSYRLFFHVQERLRAHTGHVLLHGCGCNHIVQEVLSTEGRFPLLPPAAFATVAKEWLDHTLAEFDAIFVRGFPFRLNPEDFGSVRVVAG